MVVKKKKKIDNPKTETTTRSKYCWEEYRHIGTWKLIPYNEATVERLATAFIEWARETDKTAIEFFWLDQGISGTTFKNMRNRHPVLEDAYNFVRELMAAKREELVHKGQADRHVIGWRQPAYSKEVKEVEEWRSSLKSQQAEAGAGGTQYVVLRDVPTSEDVPEREDK